MFSVLTNIKGRNLLTLASGRQRRRQRAEGARTVPSGMVRAMRSNVKVTEHTVGCQVTAQNRVLKWEGRM